MKKAIIVIITLVVVLAIGLSVLMGVGIAGGLKGIGVDFSNMTKLVNTRSFSGAEYEKLDIIYRSDSVTLVSHPGDEIILEEYMSNDDPAQYARVLEGRDTLQIEQGDRPVTFFLFGLNISYAKVYVPETWLGDLGVTSKSGSVRCEQALRVNTLRAISSSGSLNFAEITTQGDAELNASSGSVKADGITCGGALTLSAQSGSIRPGDVTARELSATVSSGSLRCGDIRAEKVTASSNSGSVEIDSLEGAFNLKNSSGSIRVHDGAGYGSAFSSSGSVNITLGKLTGDLAAAAKSGSVRIHLPANTGIDFVGETNSGAIRTPFDNELSYNKKGNRAEGKYGSAPYHKVSCESSSGSVHLEWN